MCTWVVIFGPVKGLTTGVKVDWEEVVLVVVEVELDWHRARLILEPVHPIFIDILFLARLFFKLKFRK